MANRLFRTFYPDRRERSVYGMDFAALYAAGVRGLAFDIDNTLVPHGAAADARAIALFQQLHAMGFATCLVSNNLDRRVRPFAAAVQSPYLALANKPAVKGYQTALATMGCDAAHAVFIGDQLFTDLWGARRAGIASILVNPIDPHEGIHIVLKRFLERPILAAYEREMAARKRG